MMTETPGRLREMWALHATLQGQPEEDALEFAAELDELLPVEHQRSVAAAQRKIAGMVRKMVDGANPG